MNVVVENILTNYELSGKGPVILFIHGWGDSAKTFLPLTEILKTNFTCVVLDLPGAGASQNPPEAWEIADYANFVANFVRKIKINPACIVGHSNGGTISIFLTSNKLLQPAKLVLMASAGVRDEKQLRKQGYKLAAKTGKKFTQVLPKKLEQKIKLKLYQSAGSDIFVAPHLEETFKKVVGYDAQRDAEKISVPTILIYGENDQDTPPHYGRKLSNSIKGSELTLLPNEGHFLHQTATGQIAKEIKEFLA